VINKKGHLSMKPVTNQVAHPITLTNTSINYKAPAASKLSQLIPVPSSLDTPLAKKLLKSLGNAMQYNYNMDSYYNFLNENYVITSTIDETQELLDDLSIAGYCICSRHSIDEILQADKVIIRVASTKPAYIESLQELAKTALFIIPNMQREN
jgi:hypothetical protein